MDCFFAAVEVRENPSLRGKAIAVGGTVQNRGVVATCSYEARSKGVHSAMAMSRALILCPNLVVLPVKMDLYKSVSAAIQAIFYEYTDLIEPLSLDEAFIDVSELSNCNGSATLMAQEIRQRIFSQERITASAGVAPNKFLAKVASDWNKPNGQFVITPDEVDSFVASLPVEKIFGVGKVTAKKMADRGITSCGDLQQYSRDQLIQYFGSFGERLFELSRGIDDREVKTHRIRKSLSVEQTFAQDIPTLEACFLELPELYRELLVRLKRVQDKQVLYQKAVVLKLRFNNFETTTVQATTSLLEKKVFYRLCTTAWERGMRPVRLIGIGVMFHPPDRMVQLELNF